MADTTHAKNPDSTQSPVSNTAEASKDPSNDSLEEQVRRSLTAVLDPEMGFNIVELGLIYEIHAVEAGRMKIRMTLTSPMCPVGPEILSAAKVAALNVDGVEEVDIDLVWTPPWDPKKHASEEVKGMFGIWE